MSSLPHDYDELAALAGEYVLGTLDARDARMVVQSLSTNADLAALVAAWEGQLAPLTLLVPPEAPPRDMWARIDASINSAVVAASPRAGSRFLRLWQGWAIGASLAAAALAVVAFLPRTPEPRIMTMLVSDGSQTAWTAEVDQRGALRLAALAAPGGATVNTAPQGRALQMWALPPGATTPINLGLVPRGAGAVSIANPAVKPVPGMLIEISLEPPGGAPGRHPTGPVLFIGRLTKAGPST
jgi:anti-sigma-K factor RskA